MMLSFITDTMFTNTLLVLIYSMYNISPSTARVCGSAIKLHPAHQSQPCSAVPSPGGPSHAFLSRDSGCQGGVRATASRQQLSLAVGKGGSPLGHWGPSLKTLCALTLHSCKLSLQENAPVTFFTPHQTTLHLLEKEGNRCIWWRALAKEKDLLSIF